MEKNPLAKGIIEENFQGVGAVSRDMVDTRARELALIAGRPVPEVAQSDYEQAKRELTGEKDIDRQTEILDAIPESKRWDPVPGSEGRRMPESQDEEEDEEGLSETAQLSEQGVLEAGHDRCFRPPGPPKGATGAKSDPRPLPARHGRDDRSTSGPGQGHPGRR